MRFFNKIGEAHPDHIDVITNQKAFDKITDTQITQFGAKFNSLDKNHALWNRITDKAVESLTNKDKINCIAVNKLQFLTNYDTIRAVSRYNVVHLKKNQLVHRRDSAAAYIIGVLTLGIAGCVIAMIGYLAIPFCIHGWKENRITLSCDFIA